MSDALLHAQQPLLTVVEPRERQFGKAPVRVALEPPVVSQGWWKIGELA